MLVLQRFYPDVTWTPFNKSDNGDALVWALMMVLSLVLVLLPVIPGLRSVPRLTRAYRLIWREHYRQRR